MLIGLITLHVDDALLAGSSEVEADWEKLQKELKFGSWTDLKEGGKSLDASCVKVKIPLP